MKRTIRVVGAGFEPARPVTIASEAEYPFLKTSVAIPVTLFPLSLDGREFFTIRLSLDGRELK